MQAHSLSQTQLCSEISAPVDRHAQSLRVGTLLLTGTRACSTGAGCNYTNIYMYTWKFMRVYMYVYNTTHRPNVVRVIIILITATEHLNLVRRNRFVRHRA